MMSKEYKTGEMMVEKEDLVNVFLDNGANQLEDQVFLSKKKMLNAQKGQNELFELLKMKMKGLDMLYTVLSNNKELIAKEDLLCVETLLNLLSVAKNEKNLYVPITKKIKQITCFLIKNQANLQVEENYPQLIKFVIYLLNIAYENSFFQQIANFINANDNLRELFVKELIEKVFCGRNVNMNFNNISFMFRYIITAMKFSPIEIVLTLTERLKQRANGGARTIHQSLQCAMLIGYIFDVLASKEMLNAIEKEKIVEVYEETYKAIEDQIEDNVEKKKGMFREIKKMLNKIENYYDKTKENKKGKNLLMSVEGFKTIKEKINSIYETKIQIAKKEEEKKK